MIKKHKHYDVIVAWAEGKKIQIKYVMSSDWKDWDSYSCPPFIGLAEYRIKPEPKPDVVRLCYVNTYVAFEVVDRNPNLRLTFDGETGKLKQAEVI